MNTYTHFRRHHVAKAGIDLRTKGIVATDDELHSELARFTEEAERQIMTE